MFEKVLVKKPKRARFDFSHGNTLSMQFGRLTPTEMRFIVPGDDVSVSMEQIVRLAPLPVPTFVNMKVRHDWFFVPLSMMYNQESMDLLFSQNPGSYQRAHVRNMSDYVQLFTGMPTTYGDFDQLEPFVAGSLHDYFNLPVFTDVNMYDFGAGNLNPDWVTFQTTPTSANYTTLRSNTKVKQVTDALPGPILEPLLGFHYIWRDWYQFTGMDSVYGTTYNSWLENHVFNKNFLTKAVQYTTGYINWSDFGVDSSYMHTARPQIGSSLCGTKYVYFKKDMFNSVRYGNKPQVLIPTGASGTIPNLRQASALQKFIDIIAVAGARYWDKVKALWNETPTGMKCERAQFLGRYMAFIKVGEVITTANTTQGNTGDYAGRGLLVDGRYIFKRHFTEHGWLFCVSSIVPEMAYNGYDRQLTDWNILDTPIPSFANIGDQSVINREIRVMYDNTYDNTSSFGDQFRYYAYKSDVNRIHGDFLMDSFRAWTALLPENQYVTMDPRAFGLVDPIVWNKIFAFTVNANRQPFFNGRFFLDLTFHEFITRNLPKYVSYAL